MVSRTPHWECNGKYEIAVVGTSFHRAQLQQVALNPPGRQALVFCCARLVAENDNPHDSNAVAVCLEGLTIGHLSREFAPTFRRAAGATMVSTADAVISNGLKTEERDYSYTVELDIAPTLRLSSTDEPLFPELQRINRYAPLRQDTDGSFTAKVWIPVAAHDALHKRRTVTSWTTDHWNTVNFYADNRKGIGLGFKVFEIPKAQYSAIFGQGEPQAILEALNGRVAVLRIRATSSDA